MQLLTAKNRCILDEKQFSLKKLKKCIFSKMQVCTCIYYKRNIYYINLYTCIISTHLTGRYWTIGDVTFGKNDNRTQSQFFEQKMAAVKTAGADYLESLPNTIIKRLCIYLYVCMHLNMYIYIYMMCVCVCHYLYIIYIVIVMIIKIMIMMIIIIIYVPSENIVIKTITEKPEKLKTLIWTIIRNNHRSIC